MKIIDDSRKKLNWFTRNYFFAGTLTIILINILIYAILGNKWLFSAHTEISRLLNAFLGCFSHENWQHVLLNMACLAFCGAYLERKTGSMKFVLLVMFLCFFSRMAVITVRGTNTSHGFSNVNYALYGFIVIEFIFSFVRSLVKKDRNRFDIILGGVIGMLILIVFFFNGGTEEFSFSLYPHDFLQPGHWSGFIVGVMTSLLLQIDWKITIP